MSTRNLLIGGGIVLLLLAAAFWVLLQPPRGHAQSAATLSATNPALDVRYHYDPNIFKPAPYDSRSEFPLRLDASDWAFYGKRIQGVGDLLVKEPQPVVYSYVNDANVEVYTDYYKLKQNEATKYQDVQLAGQKGVRQRLMLELGPDSEGWPPYFPLSIRGDSVARFLSIKNEAAEKAFSGIPEVDKQKKLLEQKQQVEHPVAPKAYIYGWALFNKSDLFFFQAVSPHPLSDNELEICEAMINAIEFGAMIAAPAAPPADTPAPGAPANPAAPDATGQTPAKPDAPGSPPAAPPAIPPSNPPTTPPATPPTAPPAAPGG